MQPSDDWKTYWDQIAKQGASDFDYDHFGARRDRELEELSNQELVAFVDPQPHEVIFDAGCGTGANMLLLRVRAKHLIGIDFAQGAVDRCRQRIADDRIPNVEISQGVVTKLSLPDRSVDKVICMSVFQYLTDSQVQEAMAEFRRVLKPNGVLVVHVKNRSSIYLSTLMWVKRIKRLLGRQTNTEHVRTFGWYARLLRSFGFELTDYNSFNVLMVDRMPQSVLRGLKKAELRYYKTGLYRLPLIRKHGSDLKMKGRLRSATS